MGHTLVALFDTEGERKISSLVETVGQKQLPNKIPYGRDCDREKANERLPYHMTVFHWGKAMDAVYLDRLQSFQFTPCSIKVTGVSCMYAEEGSMLLYLNVEPDQGYMRLKEELECVLQSYTSGFLHITLAVSKEHDQILELKNSIEKQNGFPFRLNISSLGLYHIWKPVELVKVFKNI